MVKSTIKTVDEYIQLYPSLVQTKLKELRSIVLSIEEIEEKIAWGLPTYYYQKKYLIQYGANKNDIGFYTSPETILYFKEKLSFYITNSKNTTRFPYCQALPTPLIKEMILYRMKEVK